MTLISEMQEILLLKYIILCKVIIRRNLNVEGDLFPKATSTPEFVWLERLEKWKHGLIL